MPEIKFDSATDYIAGIKAVVAHALGGAIGTTFDADASLAGSKITMTLRTKDLYIIKFNGHDIRDDAYTAHKLNREISSGEIFSAVATVVELTPAGDNKINFEGKVKDVFIISVAEALRFPMIAFMIGFCLHDSGLAAAFNTADLKFINQWEQVSRLLNTTGRSDMNICTLLRNTDTDRLDGGNCRLKVYDWIEARLRSGNVTQSEVESQLRLIPSLVSNLTNTAAG